MRRFISISRKNLHMHLNTNKKLTLNDTTINAQQIQQMEKTIKKLSNKVDRLEKENTFQQQQLDSVRQLSWKHLDL